MVCEHFGAAESPRRCPPGDLIRELPAGAVIAADGGQNCLVVQEIPAVKPVSVGLANCQALVRQLLALLPLPGDEVVQAQKHQRAQVPTCRAPRSSLYNLSPGELAGFRQAIDVNRCGASEHNPQG